MFRGVLPFVLLAVSAWVLSREIQALRWADVAESIAGIAPGRAVLAAVVVIFTYWILTFYDLLAIVHLSKPLRYSRVLLTAVIASAFSHNIGASFLSGGSVRYRMYSSWGFSTMDVVRVIAFCALTFWVGFFATAGTMCFVVAGGPELPIELSASTLRTAGVVSLAVVTGYFVLSAAGRPLYVRQLALTPPRPPIALAQMVVGTMEWLLMTTILYLLLPEGVVSYTTLLALFLFAHMAGLVSQVPGGLGVFEYVLLNALEPALSAHTVLGRLVVYRVLYYFCPFVVGVLLLSGSEIVRRRSQIARLLRRGFRRSAALRASRSGSE